MKGTELERTHCGQHDDCFGCHLQTVQLGNVEAPPERNIEKQWERDLPAYKRLRQNKLQPPRTQGAAELEARARTQREVELGRIINPTAWAQVGHAIEDAEAVARQVTSVTPAEIREWKHAAPR